jgi:SAM-dependent methyltransferase
MRTAPTIPAWKKWLSYLMELHVESAPSPYNPHLYVSLSRGRYQLSTANAIYSHGDLYTNFTSTFRQINLDQLPGKRILVLGLGLGSVPYMLETTFGRTFRYTAVEIDESVIYLAEKYVLSELRSQIEVVQADAHAFVLQNESLYDLIAMDVFVDDEVPAKFESQRFLTRLRESLQPGGLLLYNRLARTQDDKSGASRFLESNFRPVFPEAGYLEIDGNWMLYNNPSYLI